VVVIGEGEGALEELLPRLARSARGGAHALDDVRGVVFRRDDGAPVRTLPRPQLPDLDALPDPDREAIDSARYVETWRTHHGVGSISLICARGCPYHCNWCSHAVYGNTHRRRSPARVAAEVEFLLERYKTDQLWYADDVFTIKRSWFFEYRREPSAATSACRLSASRAPIAWTTRSSRAWRPSAAGGCGSARSPARSASSTPCSAGCGSSGCKR
jgi:radical SAM superfamily enzyme YgiQ (UPF0313 family)